MKYAQDQEYPVVKVESKNIYYASLLLSDYAGSISELSAITQYSFQNFNCFKKYPDFAEVMENIARVEMKHLELLGKTIHLLGLAPKYKAKEPSSFYYQYWNANNINYDTFIITMLKHNIYEEQLQIRNYRYHLCLINDRYIQNLLNRIIADEQIHITCFQELLKKYTAVH